MKTNRFASLLLVVLFSTSILAALPRITAIRPDLGVIYSPNLDPNKQTPNLLTYVLGCGVIMPLAQDSLWSFEPSADIYTNYYELDDLGRAVPTDTDNRDAFVLGLILDAPIVASWRFGEGEKWTVSAGAGPSFDLRVGFLAADESDAEEAQGPINAYFWKAARFFQPTTFLRAEYMLTERVGFGFATRFYWPVFNLWAGEGLGFFDQLLFCGSLGINYRL